MSQPASDDGAPRTDHLCLFSHPSYHGLNLRAGQEIVRHDHVVDGRLVGTLVGIYDGTVFDSGWSAPFGGPDVVRADELAGEVRRFLDGATTAILARGATLIRIRARPAFHSRNEDAVVLALLNLGYTVERTELTLGIDLTGIDGIEAYLQRLRSPARRALKRGLGAGLDWAIAETPEQWARAYALLAENRAVRGVQLKLSLDYMLKARACFPERIRMYLLTRGDALLAAALVYRVKRDCDYVVAWGDDRSARDLGPINMVAYRLVEEAVGNGVTLIDLGISTVDGAPDDGLIQFKRHIGASTGLRLDLIKRAG